MRSNPANEIDSVMLVTQLALLSCFVLESHALKKHKHHSSSSDSSSVSSSTSVSLERYDTDSERIASFESEGKVRFRKLVKDDDIATSYKSKTTRSPTRHFEESIIKSKRKQHSSKNKKSSTSLKPLSYFAPSKAVCREHSYIAESANRQPRYPGGPQKVGFTFSRSWKGEVEKRISKAKKKRGSSEKEWTSSAANGFVSKFAAETRGIVKDPVDAGWWLVSFEAGRSDALNTFTFKSKRQVIVSVVDLFCRGDSFAILDEGKLVAQTSRVRADSKCKDVVTSPQVAIEDGRWSSVVFDLEPGKHSISLRVIDNPNGGGMAAIRFESAQAANASDDSSSEDNDISSDSSSQESDSNSTSSSSDRKTRTHFSGSQVCKGYNGFVVIMKPLSMSKAGKACEKINSKVANLNGKSKNFEAALKSAYTCLGSNKEVWVDAKDNDGVADLVLKVGKGGKSGKLIQPDHEHPVLCERN